MASGLENYRVCIGITGASGSAYAERLIECLIPLVPRIYLLITDTGRLVAEHELNVSKEGFSLRRFLKGEVTDDQRTVIRQFGLDNLFAPLASGSSAPSHMVILPCSMGTLGRIAGGVSSNLLERTADVVMKQRKPLIIAPRETPLNLIHLRNMTTLAEAGAIIAPPMGAFYQKPSTVEDMVDFVVGRVLELIGIEQHELYSKWNSRLR